MSLNYYKYCVVPKCRSTTKKTPNKLFIQMPSNKQTRKKWLQLARRDTNVSSRSRLYFCEDHFDLATDMENYMEYHVMGSVSQIRMKPGCLPRKFECQPDRNKRTSNNTERSYILKKQRKMLIEECEKDLEKRNNITQKINQLIFKVNDTSSASSVMQPIIGNIKQDEPQKNIEKSIHLNNTPQFNDIDIKTEFKFNYITSPLNSDHQCVSTKRSNTELWTSSINEPSRQLFPTEDHSDWCISEAHEEPSLSTVYIDSNSDCSTSSSTVSIESNSNSCEFIIVDEIKEEASIS